MSTLSEDLEFAISFFLLSSLLGEFLVHRLLLRSAKIYFSQKLDKYK